VCRANPTLSITLNGASVIVKENRMIAPRELVNGDFIRVTTTALNEIPDPGDSIDGIIVRVDR
jgi:hypothetical protein